MEYRYLAYGMNIASELDCPGLPAGYGEPEVRVNLGRLPPFWKTADRKQIEYVIEPDRVIFSIDGVGTFLVRNGNHVTVDPGAMSSKNEVRSTLLNSALSVVMYQQGLLVMHGSVIETPDGAMVFGGKSGAGKSTLAAMFRMRGYHILSDDVCVICHCDETPVVRPSYPELKLCRDSVAYLNYDREKVCEQTLRDSKSVFPIQDSYRDKNLNLCCFYEIATADDPCLSLKVLSGFDKFLALARNIYRPQVLENSAFLRQLSTLVAQIAEKIKVKQACRSGSTVITDELADLIERDLCPRQKAN
jgi:hypothetical protein